MIFFFIFFLKGCGNSAIQQHPQPKNSQINRVFPELRPHSAPQVSSVPGLRVSCGPWGAAGTGLRSSVQHRALCRRRITGSPSETHPSGGGTEGGELATGCGKESHHRRIPCLLEAMAGWLFDFILFMGIRKKGKWVKREGEAHTLAHAYGRSYLHIEILLRFAHCST